jgi:DNA-binding MarR family transcriptional regulator
MDRFLEILKGVIDTVYLVFMTPGEWLASKTIEHAPLLATSLGISAEENSVLAPLILSILSWMIIALLGRRLLYSFRNLLNAIGIMFMRIKFRTLIALHSLTAKFGLESLMWWKDAEPEVESSKLSLNRLDLMVLKLAKAAGPGFALSAPELSERMNLRPAQIQECLDKLSQNSLLDFTRGTTDGYENYRLNETGAYILTMWQEYQARA